ncbi:MAG: hypothetical protein V1918_03570 [Planctomycetota bacterium]
MLLPFILPVALAAVLFTPHLKDEIWMDEAYALEHFAAGNIRNALTDYHMATNHVVFSLVVSLWRKALGPALGEETAYLRFPVVLFSLGAVAALFFATRRMAGAAAGCLASTIFATSHVTANFAAQLRGYSFSWLMVILGWYCLILCLESPRWWRLCLYGLCAAVAVGLLPTNLLWFALLAAWAILPALPSRPWRDRKAFRRLLYIAFVPLVGLAWYLGDVRGFLLQSLGLKSRYTLGPLLGEWYLSTARDFWWLVIPAVPGLWFLFRSSRENSSQSPDSPRGKLLFVVLTAVGFVPLLCCMRAVPYPRHILPIQPLMYAGLALLLAESLQGFAPRLHGACPRLAAGAPVVLVAVLWVLGFQREADDAGYYNRHKDTDMPLLGIYDLYFQNRYFNPSGVLTELDGLCRSAPTTIFTNENGKWPLLWLLVHKYHNRLGSDRFRTEFFYVKDAEVSPKRLYFLAGSGRQVLLVARGSGQAQAIAHTLYERSNGDEAWKNISPQSAAGFFKIFQCRNRPAMGEP